MLKSPRRTFRPVRFGCAVSLALLVATGVALAQPVDGPLAGDATLRDGVVVDPIRSVLYLMKSQGGIDAVDIATGEVLWTTDAAAKPLYLHQVLLVAQTEGDGGAGSLEIVVLNTEVQGQVQRRITVPLPTDVRPAIDDALGRSFRTLVQRLPEATIVSWTYLERTVRGVPPDSDEDPALQREGAFAVNAASGQVTLLDPDEVAQLPGPPDLELPPNERLENVPGRQFGSADRRFVLASERVADPRAYRRYQWTIYRRASGEIVGALTHPAAVVPFLVTDSTVLYETRPVRRRESDAWIEEPLMVRAADALSGFELWALEVRDTEYRGPVPP